MLSSASNSMDIDHNTSFNLLPSAFWPATPLMPPGFQNALATRLPARVLELIFVEACEVEDYAAQLPSAWMDVAKDVLIAPLRITWVCKRWRYIANTTPALWRNLPVSLSPVTDPNADELIEQFFKKADHRTVNVCFFLTNTRKKYTSDDSISGYFYRDLPKRYLCIHPYEEGSWFPWDETKSVCWPEHAQRTAYNEHAMRAIHATVQYCERWGKAYFSGRIDCYVKFFLHLPRPMHLPLLHALEIMQGLGDAPECNGYFENAYALRQLTLIEAEATSFFLPWRNLTSIHFKGSNCVQVVEILLYTPRLVELRVSDVFYVNGLNYKKYITLSELQSVELYVTLPAFDEITGLIDGGIYVVERIVAPALKSLKFYNNRESDEGSCPLLQLRRFISSSDLALIAAAAANTTPNPKPIPSSSTESIIIHRPPVTLCTLEAFTTLTIISVVIDERDLIHMLHVTTALETLVLHIGHIWGPGEELAGGSRAKYLKYLLNHLSDYYSPGGRIFLPALHNFECFGLGFSVKSLVAMLEKRAGPEYAALGYKGERRSERLNVARAEDIQPLKDVHVHLPTPFHVTAPLRAKIDALRASGMNLLLNDEFDHCGCPPGMVELNA